MDCEKLNFSYFSEDEDIPGDDEKETPEGEDKEKIDLPEDDIEKSDIELDEDFDSEE